MKRIYFSGLVSVLIVLVTLVTSCRTGPKALKLGVDHCDYCMMTVSDARFGGEIITKKGKLYCFDDPHCIISFIREKKIPRSSVDQVLLVDYSGNHEFIPADLAHLFRADALRSPMGGNIAAFRTADSLILFMKDKKGERVNWDDLIR